MTSEGADSLLSRGLIAWVGTVRRYAIAALALALVGAWLALGYARDHLGINTDTADMISEHLPWRRAMADYDAAFPQDSNTVLVVIDAPTAELAEAAARFLEAELATGSDLVQWVYRPGGDAFFARHGLLYLDVDALLTLSDRLTRLQPFIGSLARDPSVRGLADLLHLAVAQPEASGRLDLAPFLDAMARAATSSAPDAPTETVRAVSWRGLFAGTAAEGVDAREFLVVKPNLDYAQLLPAGPVLERIHQLGAEVASLGSGQSGVRVRITGGTAMEHEELESVSRGAGIAGAAALVLVAVVLLVGLRSVRLVAASLLTLAIGLLWTGAFAAFAVGDLNLISVAFAVLYIGLGVDYAVHLGLRYQELRVAGRPHEEALPGACADVGRALVLCTVTTGIGFYSFVPTDFSGISELGLISGTGMFISLFANLTVLPAALELLPPRTPSSVRGIGLSQGLSRVPVRFARSLVAVFGVAALLALGLLPLAHFDDNPLNLRDPGGEAVSTYRELMDDPDSTPWAMVDLVSPSGDVVAIKHELERLPEVDSVRHLSDWVPAEQPVKLAIVEELDLLLGFELDSTFRVPPPDAELRRKAVRSLLSDCQALVQAPTADAATVEAARRAGRALQSVQDAPDATLLRFESAMVEGLAAELERLTLALQAGPVERADLPASTTTRWLAADGRQRIEILPSADLDEREAREQFVDRVSEVRASATGSALVYRESGRVVARAFLQAFGLAIALIALVLVAVLRSGRDVALVLMPLLIAALLTTTGMLVIGVPFNFANVIALPLLLGIGVDNGVHLVHRLRNAGSHHENLLGSATARAICVSALTTICSFGSLAFSAHPGTASMGQVLAIGLALALACSLLLTPALASIWRTSD